MINKDTCTLYELFAADWNGGHPKAGSGAIFHLGSDALRPATWTSADAAGLPIFPGLGALGRGEGGVHRPRDPFHGGLHLDGTSSGPHGTRPGPRIAGARRWGRASA